MGERTGGFAAAIYNVLSVLFLLLTCGAAAGVIYALTVIGPQPVADGGAPTPTLYEFVLPTQPPPGVADAPTSLPPTASPMPESSPTAGPAAESEEQASDTPTLPAPGGTATASPEVTVSPGAANTQPVTAVASATAVTGTPLPFDFVLRDNSVTYTQNFANDAGCDWAGIAGTVFDLDGNHLTDVLVHVFGNGIDQMVASGSNRDYGRSGWEVVVGTAPTDFTFTAVIEDEDENPLSEYITVEMIDDCSNNLALLIFDQVQ